MAAATAALSPPPAAREKVGPVEARMDEGMQLKQAIGWYVRPPRNMLQLLFMCPAQQMPQPFQHVPGKVKTTPAPLTCLHHHLSRARTCTTAGTPLPAELYT
jgi:hypothetical protein